MKRPVALLAVDDLWSSWKTWLRARPVLARVIDGFTVRPWLIDIGCGLCSLWWGLWVGLHHQEVAMSPGFSEFRPVVPQLSAAVFLLGALQILIAIVKNRTHRTLIAMVSVVIWSGLAIGVRSAAGQGAYTGHALLNILIIVRAF